MCVAAASLTRELLTDGASVGLAAASFTGSPSAWMAGATGVPGAAGPRRGAAGAHRAHRLGPFGALLTWLTRRVPAGATIVVVTARDPRGHLPALRRLRRSGTAWSWWRRAPAAASTPRLARRAGLAASSAEVKPNVEHAEAVILAAEVLLPTVQVLAEGSWLAVVYAALQAVAGQQIWVGPIELAMAAWGGLAWGRRSRWLSPAAEALGLPLLALLAGVFGWLLDPLVRTLLVDGRPWTRWACTPPDGSPRSPSGGGRSIARGRTTP